MRGAFGVLPQADTLQHIINAAAHLRRRHAEVAQAEGRVFLDGRADDLIFRIRQHYADAKRSGVPRCRRLRGNARNQHLPGGRRRLPVAELR